MPILAIAVTTIECDGNDGAACPNNTIVEYPHPQSVSIRLAKQSGWTVWMETTCPECSRVPVPAAAAPKPLAPAALTVEAVPALMVLEADAGEDALGWCAALRPDRRRVLAAA